MKHTLLTSLLVTVALACFANPMEDNTPEGFRAYLIDMVSKYGCSSINETERAITFNNGKGAYCIEIGDESPALIQLKRIYPIMSHYSRVQLLNEVNDANIMVKCAHALLSDDGDVITLTVEVMLLDGNDFSAAFPTYLASLDDMAQYFDRRLP